MGEITETFLFLAAGADPAADRVVREHVGGTTLLVWVPDGAAAARVAAEQADAGVRLIELYRGFDLDSAARVIAAVGGRVPVGVAGYGFGSSPAARPIRDSVTIYHSPGADPAADRILRSHAGARTTVVAAPDDSAATAVAVDLVDRGVDLVEVCGGMPLTAARQIQDAIGGRVPVSLVSWPFESIDGVAAYKAAFEQSVG